MVMKWRGAQVMQEVRRAAARGVLRGTEAVKTEAISLMQSSPATGRRYQRRGVTHIASSPGNPPRPDTGTLIARTRTEYDNGGLRGRVMFSASHAPLLEFGTEKMEPRPFARPALSNQRAFIREAITDEIRAVLRRGR